MKMNLIACRIGFLYDMILVYIFRRTTITWIIISLIKRLILNLSNDLQICSRLV